MTTWAGARANIKTQLHGITISSPSAETLTAYEYPPSSRQSAHQIPYAYIVPPAIRVTRMPGGWRETYIDTVRVRIFLAGQGEGKAEDLATRRDAWIASLLTAFDDAVALDLAADAIGDQEFGEIAYMEPDNLWGFEMELRGIRVSEAVTLSA